MMMVMMMMIVLVVLIATATTTTITTTTTAPTTTTTTTTTTSDCQLTVRQVDTGVAGLGTELFAVVVVTHVGYVRTRQSVRHPVRALVRGGGGRRGG